MSHSQFHSLDLFKLTHAWLNLWDKRMTTGRINQVTIVKSFVTSSVFFYKKTKKKQQTLIVSDLNKEKAENSCFFLTNY